MRKLVVGSDQTKRKFRPTDMSNDMTQCEWRTHQDDCQSKRETRERENSMKQK